MTTEAALHPLARHQPQALDPAPIEKGLLASREPLAKTRLDVRLELPVVTKRDLELDPDTQSDGFDGFFQRPAEALSDLELMSSKREWELELGPPMALFNRTQSIGEGEPHHLGRFATDREEACPAVGVGVGNSTGGAIAVSTFLGPGACRRECQDQEPERKPHG